jgi:O-antigen/teichoic acid export membrane protein
VWVLEWSSQTIRDIFILWCTGASISIIVGAAYIRFNFKFKVDISWIKKGIKIATPFFIATVFYKVIEFSGRYFLDFFWSKEEVGVFTFYSGLSNAMFIFVHSTVIIVMSPYLIESSNKGIKEFLRIFKSFRNQILYTSTIGFTLAAIFIYPLLIYLDNALLMQNFEVYFLLLVAVTFFCFSYIPHYGLYTFHKDKSLLLASLIGAVVNVGANFAMVPKYGVMGAAVAQVLSMLMLLITKQILFKRMLNE